MLFAFKNVAIINTKAMARLLILCVLLAIWESLSVTSIYAQSAEEEPLAQLSEDEVKPRKFNDVLFDLLNEFSYDLKKGELKGIPNTSLRRVALSEGIPKSYETYLESLVAERFRKFGSTKVIHCAECKVKRSALRNGRVVISVPINSPTELDRISEVLKIETWTDAALLYQESSMLLAINIFDAKTKEMIWTKIYNSETIYERVSSRPPTQEDIPSGKATFEEQKSVSSYAGFLGLGWFLVPNVKKPSNMIGTALRLSERFNAGRSEIGASAMIVMDPGLFFKNYPGVEGDPANSDEVQVGQRKEIVRPFKVGMGFFGGYVHNFFKETDTADGFRISSHLDLGTIIAAGYITFGLRIGPIFRFGNHLALEMSGIYSAPTTLSIGEQYSYKTKGGIGADVTFGWSF